MVARWSLFVFLVFLPACGTVRNWRELQSDPMPVGECYQGIQEIATRNGFTLDADGSDRGEGILQTRWRARALPSERNMMRGRYRLYLEILVDEGSATEGWPIRFCMETQWVEDLRRDTNPTEEDWSPHGQDSEAEAIFAEQLVRRVAPKSLAGPRGGNKAP